MNPAISGVSVVYYLDLYIPCWFLLILGPSIATAKHNFDSPWRYQNLSSPKSSLAERMNLNEKLATAKNSKTTEDLEKNDTRIQGLQQAPHSALIYSIFPKVPPCLRFSEGNDKS